jgi:iron complex outermembrane receptor protein
VSGSYYDTDGFIDNSYLGEEADPFKDLSGRARLIWDVSEDFTADFRISASKTETQALYFNITEDVNDTSLDVRVNNRGVNERNMFGLSMKLDWETGVGTLTSITAYDTLDEILTGDQFNFLPVEESVLYAFFGADQAQHQWLDVSSVSQELRLTSPSDQRLRWITGVYAIATDRFISTGNVFDLSPVIPGWQVPEVKEDPLPLFDPQFSFLADEQDNLAWAVFGEIEYDISERLELAVALRYDRDDRENTTRTPDEFLPTDDAVSGEVRDETWDEWQPKLTLTYKASDELVVYGGYSRGFRSGGFNQTGVGAANIAGVNDLFDKEVADTFEAGAKAMFLDRRLSVNGSLYYTEAEGSYFFVYDPNTGTQNLGNLDEVEYKGAELEFQAAAAEWLDLYARFGWTDSEIKKSSRDPEDVGNQAPLVSKYTVNLGAQFKGMLPFGEDLGWFIRPDYQIIGDTYWYPDNYTVRDPVNLLNLRAGVNGEAWTFTVWSRNLTDEEYNAEWSPGPQFFPNPGYTNNFVFKALPMVWGLELSYRF